ncbi:hypothetical protein [Lysobacter gummosus]|uniref:hypothetical protein n=1 Tax=Lysobacter gummosus TaxID=262324 RepID=UPI0036274BBD
MFRAPVRRHPESVRASPGLSAHFYPRPRTRRCGQWGSDHTSPYSCATAVPIPIPIPRRPSIQPRAQRRGAGDESDPSLPRRRRRGDPHDHQCRRRGLPRRDPGRPLA